MKERVKEEVDAGSRLRLIERISREGCWTLFYGQQPVDDEALNVDGRT